jgi:hypothetical protein
MDPRATSRRGRSHDPETLAASSASRSVAVLGVRFRALKNSAPSMLMCGTTRSSQRGMYQLALPIWATAR